MWGCSRKLVNTSRSHAVNRTPPDGDGSTNYGTTFECAFNNWHLARYFESNKMEISWINKEDLKYYQAIVYEDKEGWKMIRKWGGIYNNHDREDCRVFKSREDVDNEIKRLRKRRLSRGYVECKS